MRLRRGCGFRNIFFISQHKGTVFVPSLGYIGQSSKSSFRKYNHNLLINKRPYPILRQTGGLASRSLGLRSHGWGLRHWN